MHIVCAKFILVQICCPLGSDGRHRWRCKPLNRLVGRSSAPCEQDSSELCGSDQSLVATTFATASSSEGGKLDQIPIEKLKALRKLGLSMKDVIKLGRRGVAPSVVVQIQNRWRTSEVAKLYCGGKAGINMKAMAATLEQETGGIVIHRSGGSVFLYRGGNHDPCQPSATEDET